MTRLNIAKLAAKKPINKQKQYQQINKKNKWAK